QNPCLLGMTTKEKTKADALLLPLRFRSDEMAKALLNVALHLMCHCEGVKRPRQSQKISCGFDFSFRGVEGATPYRQNGAYVFRRIVCL
ncbi:MAG: hypothetical protein MJ096_06865, partial [Clostridia bacterium]|nr:hypothetical protein [Clostridia bacterium]